MSHFNEYMVHKALTIKFNNSKLNGRFIDKLLESEEGAKMPEVKNVCAKLSVELVERLDNTLNMLDMSKREFIELSLVEALDRADQIIEDCGSLVQFETEGA